MSYSKNLISLRAFLGNTNIDILKLIKLCNLQHTDHWSEWVDDYGNIFKISDKKDFSIKLNETIDSQYLNSKDLYIKSHIKDITVNSKFALIAIFDESYFVWLLDEFDMLRLYYYINDVYVGACPILLSSPDTLKKIIRNLSVENYGEVFHITEPSTKNECSKAWVTTFPIDERLLTLLPEIIKKDLVTNA